MSKPKDDEKAKPIKVRGPCKSCARWKVDTQGRICDVASKVPDEHSKRFFDGNWPRTDEDYECNFWMERD